MFYDDDIDIFFSDFAIDAVYTPVSGKAKTIKIIFSRDYREMVDELVGVEGIVSSAICKSADMPDVSHNDILEINGETYYIIGVQPDDSGITTLLLSKGQA